jgi:anti-sigma B factor antagonist
MNTPSAKLAVLIGKQFACIKISGRANFTSSIDFKTVVQELRDKGYTYFVLDLAECTLMDSTFLGLLAGFGLKMRGIPENCSDRGMVLLNPSPRITELLENLGVIDLFRTVQGVMDLPPEAEAISPTFKPHGREEVTRACLEAHQTLSSLSPENAARFKDVTQFLAEDLKKIKQAGSE